MGAYCMGYWVEEEWQKREELRGTCERTAWDELSSEDEEYFWMY